MTPDEIIALGKSAELLLKHETLNRAFEEMLHEASLAWLATRPVQIDDREQLYAHAYAIQALRGKLTQWVNDAVTEQQKLERKERRKKEI